MWPGSDNKTDSTSHDCTSGSEGGRGARGSNSKTASVILNTDPVDPGGQTSERIENKSNWQMERLRELTNVRPGADTFHCEKQTGQFHDSEYCRSSGGVRLTSCSSDSTWTQKIMLFNSAICVQPGV
jgi:peroxiredoxin